MRGDQKNLFAAIATVLMLASPALAVELFRYRGAAKDGGTLEYSNTSLRPVNRILPTP
jgi:hypothetical protein